tara:strand:- start:1711 stop:2193 length:483 start_codon:yes stop_codon:yes gene_type:complete
MPTIASRQPVLSSVLMQDSFNVVENFNYEVSTIKQAADLTIAIGTVVVWSVADSAFRVLLNADVAALPATSGLVNGAPIAVVVGFDALGDAYDKEFLAATAGKSTLLFRGLASVKNTGLKFDAGVSAPNKALILKQLEKQDIAVKAASAAVAVSFYNAVV